MTTSLATCSPPSFSRHLPSLSISTEESGTLAPNKPLPVPIFNIRVPDTGSSASEELLHLSEQKKRQISRSSSMVFTAARPVLSLENDNAETRIKPPVAAALNSADFLPSPKTYVKSSRSLWNPLNWPRFIINLFRGHTESTNGMRPMGESKGAANQGFVIDGFDDAANAVQGSGISQKLAATLEAFVFYPLILPLVNLGAVGTRAEMRSANEAFDESSDKLDAAMEELLQLAVQMAPGEAQALNSASTEHALRCLLVKIFREAYATESPEARVAYAQSLARYDALCREHVTIKLKRDGAPAAVLGAHAMLGGVGLYQCGALAKFSATSSGLTLMPVVTEGSILAAFKVGTGVQGAINMFGLFGHLSMLVGQVAMAVYATHGAWKGYKQDQKLKDVRSLIQSADATLISDAAKKDMLAQNTTQRRFNFFGDICGNGALAAGQVMMALGGPIVGFGTPLLIAGAALTGVAIGTKLWMEKWNAKRFAFDPDAFDKARCQADTLEKSAELTEQSRQKSMLERAWITIGTKLESIKKAHPHKTTAQKLDLLNAAVDKLRKHPHQTELHQVLKTVRNENQAVLRLCFESTVPGLTAFTSMLQTEDEGRLTKDAMLVRIREFETKSRRERMETMMQLKELDSEWQKRAIRQLVVWEAGWSNRRGDKYRSFITTEQTSEKRKGMWGLWQWMFGSKRKTAYTFNIKAFCEALDRPDADPLRDHVENVIYSCMEKGVRKESSYQARSRLFGANEYLLELASASATLKKAATPANGPVVHEAAAGSPSLNLRPVLT